MKKVPISGGNGTGKFILVDEIDYERVVAQRWWMLNGVRSMKRVHYWDRVKKKHIGIHRFILSAPDGTIVDHVNGDLLDNRRANLRFATHSQNMRNRVRKNKTTSGLQGVYWNEPHGRTGSWRAAISVDGISIHLGRFKNKMKAYKVYREASKRYFGAFSPFNRP